NHVGGDPGWSAKRGTTKTNASVQGAALCAGLQQNGTDYVASRFGTSKLVRFHLFRYVPDSARVFRDATESSPGRSPGIAKQTERTSLPQAGAERSAERQNQTHFPG